MTRCVTNDTVTVKLPSEREYERHIRCLQVPESLASLRPPSVGNRRPVPSILRSDPRDAIVSVRCAGSDAATMVKAARKRVGEKAKAPHRLQPERRLHGSEACNMPVDQQRRDRLITDIRIFVRVGQAFRNGSAVISTGSSCSARYTIPLSGVIAGSTNTLAPPAASTRAASLRNRSGYSM